MAGTGHSYEIANIAEVRRVVNDLISQAEGHATILSWLSGKAFLRFLTSDRFVFRVRRNASPAFLQATEHKDRDFIARKWEAGQDVRLFSADQFTRSGPDMIHALDWLTELRLTRPRDYARLARISPEDLFKKVAAWIRPKSKKTKLPEGQIRKVIEAAEGHVWFELLDAAALAAEGDAMVHCVHGAAYARGVLDGIKRIFSMRNQDGRRLLTMELGRSVEHFHVVQIQAYRNEPPPEGATDAICAVLNHLGVKPINSTQERRAHICCTPEGVWQSIFKTWKRIERNGLEAITDGTEILFMSPVHPDRPLMSVISDTSVALAHLFLAEDEHERNSIRDSVTETPWWQAALVADRHLAIEELDAACRVINELSASYSDIRLVANETEECIPWVRSLVEQRDDLGNSYLLDTVSGSLYVTSAADPAMVLVEIGITSRIRRDEMVVKATTAWVFNAHRWKDHDALNCVAAMTAGKAVNIDGELVVLAELGKRFELMRVGSEKWRPFKLDATKHLSRREGFHSMETDYLIALFQNDRRFADFEVAEGALRRFPYTWGKGVDGKEIASRFNKLKLLPSDNIVPTQLNYRLKQTRGTYDCVVCVGGRWSVVRSQRALLRLVGDPSSLTVGEARVILSLVPVDPNERLREADRLFATCMALVRQTTHPDRAFLPFDKDEREAYFWLVEHLDLLTEQLRKSIVADAGNILGRWADLPKSPLGSQKDEIRLFLSVWQGLPKGVTNRVIKQVFRKNHTWLGHNAGDIRWVREIYPAIGDKHARAALYEGIAGGASAFGTVDDPDKLLVHAECLAVYARHEYVLLDYKLGTVTRAYQQLAADGVPDDKHNVMNEIATVIASIPDMVARREAAVEERRRELDRMFRWNSDLEPESKAA